MKQVSSPEMSLEVKKAFDVGYIERFVFKDGCIYCTSSPQKIYLVQEIYKQPIPCQVSKSNIYRIETPEGIKGIAIVEWIEIEQDD